MGHCTVTTAYKGQLSDLCLVRASRRERTGALGGRSVQGRTEKHLLCLEAPGNRNGPGSVGVQEVEETQ